MSINDPQWGNSHRPEQKEPEQVPESTGTEPVQPDAGRKETQPPKPLSPAPQSSPPSPQSPQSPRSPKSSPPEGPPDLEVLWQQWVYKARCRIARLLGRELPEPPAPSLAPSAVANVSQSSASPDDALPVGWQALSLKSWLIGVSLIIGAWLASGFYLVDTPQRGVLSRFGSVVAVEDPGWHWRWPYPIDSVRLINVTADRSLEVGLSAQKDRRQTPGLMLTADGNLINVAYAVRYQVHDPVAYLSRAETPVDLLALLAEGAVRDAVAGQPLATALTAGGKQTSLAGDAMLQTARQQLQAALDPLQLGIVVKGVEIRDVQLPAPVLQSIKDAERDEQARVKALREAQTASTDSLIKARKLAAKLQDESAAYASALENEMQLLRDAGAKRDAAQAQKALSEKASEWQQQYPLVFANLAALQARIQPSASAGRTAPAAAAAATNGGAVNAPAAASGGWRDREIMRSRDRVDRPGSGS